MDNSSKEKKEKISAEEIFFYQRRKQGVINVMEVIVVFIVSNIVILNGLFDSTLSHILPNYYDSFFRIPTFSKALFITIGHIIFTVVYGVSPFQLIFKKLIDPQLKNSNVTYENNSNNEGTVKSNRFEASLKAGEASIGFSETSAKQNDTAEYYLNGLIFSSRSLSKSIYNRGSLYLMIGLMCAFAGIAFFYSQTHVVDISKKASEQVLFLLPNFGVLFFLELVAFFFLRQYKTIMDEFRYYEAIKRSREETLAVIKFTLESGKEVDLAEVIEKVRFGSSSGKLEAGQSTEILEARKLDKSELETLTKLVETVVNKLGQGTK